ncbi:hypothetical protein L7F22_049979 [Adiantum nelumboides]|nr:hypothetical protein [Adiantum nelumboides]
MTFPNFHGRRGENAGNFLDDLEMAFLVCGREDEEIKLRAFPLVLCEEAKVWFQDLDMGKQSNWEALKRAFLLRYSGDNNPEEIWRKLSKLQQASPDSYLEYETQFLKLWTQWENSLPEGERAPNFLQKERFLAGLTPILREKVKCKFPESFKEALTWARLKDRKLQFQRSWRDHSQAASRVTTQEQAHPSSPNGSGDPHLDRLRRQAGGRGTNDEVLGRPPRREYQCHNYGEDEHGARAERRKDESHQARNNDHDDDEEQTEGTSGQHPGFHDDDDQDDPPSGPGPSSGGYHRTNPLVS